MKNPANRARRDDLLWRTSLLTTEHAYAIQAYLLVLTLTHSNILSLSSRPAAARPSVYSYTGQAVGMTLHPRHTVRAACLAPRIYRP